MQEHTSHSAEAAALSEGAARIRDARKHVLRKRGVAGRRFEWLATGAAAAIGEGLMIENLDTYIVTGGLTMIAAVLASRTPIPPPTAWPRLLRMTRRGIRDRSRGAQSAE